VHRATAHFLSLSLVSRATRYYRDIRVAIDFPGCSWQRTQSTPVSGNPPYARALSLGGVFEGRKGTGGNVPGAQTRGRYAARESAGSGRPQGITGRRGWDGERPREARHSRIHVQIQARASRTPRRGKWGSCHGEANHRRPLMRKSYTTLRLCRRRYIARRASGAAL